MSRTIGRGSNGPQPGDGHEIVGLPPEALLAPGSPVGDYVVEEVLGEGGMATVYGAVHPIIRKRVAIKVLSLSMSLQPELVERFIQEARAVNAIGHPNIADVFAFGTLPDRRCWFAMEWLRGETLYRRLWTRRLTVEETLDILDQTCEAVEAAHEKGIIHRDLKPANVFLVPARGGRDGVKLLDFGVAKLSQPLSDGAERPNGPRTESGKVVGTPEYISPEQARGQHVDGASDVYSLGVMAYEMILGQLPFQADNVIDTLRLHLSEPPPPPRHLWPEVPPVLEGLLLAMLHKDPVRRPSLRDVRKAICELRGAPVPVVLSDAGPATMSLEEQTSATLLGLEPGARARTPRPAVLSGPSSSRPVVLAGGPRSSQPVSALALPGRPRRRRLPLVLAATGALAALVAVAFLGGPRAPGSRPSGAARDSSLRPASPGSQGASPSAPGAALSAPGAALTELPAPISPPPAAAPSAAPSLAGREPEAAAEKAQATLIIEVNVPDARIELDGEMIAGGVGAARLGVVAPGTHQLRVTAPGRRPFQRRITVEAGANVRVPVHLDRGAPSRHEGKDPDYLVNPFGAQ